MRTNLWVIVLSIIVVLIVSVQGINEGRIGKKQTEIENLKKERTKLEIQVVELKEELQPKPYCLPLDQLWISSDCGYRTPPMGGIDGEETLHRGIDIAGNIGDPVYAMLAGFVAEHWVPPDGKRWEGHPIMGGYLVINHGDELLSEYAHLSKTFVHEGDWVEMGQIIGLVGNTGICTGPHLHAAVVISPLRYLSERR